MKEFMFIFIGADYSDQEVFSPDVLEKQMGRWFAWVDKLKAQDVYVEGRALHSGAKRVTGSDQVVSDGPFVETKELVGGYFVIKATSMEEALKYTADYPDYDYGGGLEIREIVEY